MNNNKDDFDEWVNSERQDLFDGLMDVISLATLSQEDILLVLKSTVALTEEYIKSVKNEAKS